MRKALLAILSLILVSCSSIKRPEDSKLFIKHVDPETGVVSYILQPGILDYHQQSVYFVNRSMSNDGRFILFTVSGDEFNADPEKVAEEHPNLVKYGHGKRYKEYALIDLKKDKVFRINQDFYADIEGGMICSDIPDGKMYYLSDTSVYCRNFYKNPMKAVKVCSLPENYLSEGNKILDYCCHLTLNHDRTKIFLDSQIDDKFIQGSLDLKTGEWEKWYEDDYVINHCQYNPVRDDIVLGAYETGFTDSKGVEHVIKDKYVNGIYPRLQLFTKGNREMVPPYISKYATHEKWNEQGDGFYWCTDYGVYYCDLETREQCKLSPIGVHAMMTADNRYVVADERVGHFYRGSPWKVFFWDRETGRGIYLCSIMRGISPADRNSGLHPDPHPQFVKNDEYIIYSYMGMNGNRGMNLAITPVAQLKERLEKQWLSEPAVSPKEVYDKLSSNPSTTGSWVSALHIAHKLGDEAVENDLTNKYLLAPEDAPGAVIAEVLLTRAQPIRKQVYLNYLLGHAETDAAKQCGDLDRYCLTMAGIYRASGNDLYLKKAAKELFLANDLTPGKAASISLILRYLSADSEYYNALNAKYMAIMQSAKESQSEEGLWNAESALITCGMVEGIKQGWLDSETYLPVVDKAWAALTSGEDLDPELLRICDLLI